MALHVTVWGLLSFILSVNCSINTYSSDSKYIFDIANGLGRRFDGIGAISGGGATSKLLINYPPKLRDEVLDYLFKPNFGASLQILKVEIGGDSQSSEGTESSHMHNSWDENYERGYEWWLMTEAKKRNPAIKLYGLPWGFPGWIGHGHWWPYENANVTSMYIIKWIKAADKYYNLTIDYIGIWNEKPYDPYYIVTLRSRLNESGLSHVQIVAADSIGSNAWDIVKDIDKYPELQKAVSIVGSHYTGTYSTNKAKTCGKPLWSSEDYSGEANDFGGGCLARLLNQNYVKGLMSGFIAWNLVASYYDNLPYTRHSLMVAQQPWSGYYSVETPVWVVAHTTQFTSIGWTYLKNGTGSGFLKKGGSYVSLVSPNKKDFTIVIETIDGMDKRFCLNVPMHPYKVSEQDVTFNLKGSLAKLTKLNIWRSHIIPGTNQTSLFIRGKAIAVKDGMISLHLAVNDIVTLTTVNSGNKGSYKVSAGPAPFPSTYQDTFDHTKEYQEAFNFAQQVGAFEIHQTNEAKHGKILRQMVLSPPVHWCPLVQTNPINLIGNYYWSDITVASQVRIPSVNSSAGAFLAARVDQGGCTTFLAKGVFFFLDASKQVAELSLDLARTQIVKQIDFVLDKDVWYDISLSVKGNNVTAVVNSEEVLATSIKPTSLKGFAALGAVSFGLTDFDNFSVRPS